MPHNYRKKIAFFILFVILIPNFAFAAEANYNYIISDAEATNYQSMTEAEIRDFLRDRDSYLATYKYSGNNPSPAQLALDPEKKYIQTRTVAEIIYNASQEWKINPQFLLTLMEKEMSLVTDKTPTINQLAYAMGYDCPDSGGCGFKTKGFGKQVRAAAEQFRWFIDHIDAYNWNPGQTSCADDPTPFLPCTSRGVEVTPANKITAAMYLYTPHVHGNTLFTKLWGQFGFGTGDSELPVVVVPSTGIFPDGAIIKAKDSEDGSIYLIADGEKRAFADMTSLVSRFDPAKILLVDGAELERYDDGQVIAHANYSLLQNSSGDIYLIDGLIKRLITSDEAFRQLGFNPLEVEEVTSFELAAYENGEELSESSSPFAQLWQDMDTESIYLVKDTKKHKIIDPFIIEANFPEMTIKEVTTKTFENLSNDAPVKLEDGTLIKKELDAKVYVISNGERRLIPDGTTFNALGYDWTQIHTVSNKIMNFHRMGASIISQE
jgi:hypothetical protein